MFQFLTKRGRNSGIFRQSPLIQHACQKGFPADAQQIIRIGGRGIDCDNRIIIFSENGEVDRLVTRYQNKIRI